MRNIVIGIVIGIGLCLGTYVYADTALRQAVAFPVLFDFNGEGAQPAADAEALNYNGSVYVPLRYVAQRMGAAVSYDESSRTVSVMSGGVRPLLHDPDIPGVYVGDVQIGATDRGAAAGGWILLDDTKAQFSPDKGKLTFAGLLSFYDKDGRPAGSAQLTYRFDEQDGPYRLHRFEIPVPDSITPEHRVKLYGGYLLGPDEIPQPPMPVIAAGDRRLPAATGTYCWYGCMDKAAVSVLLEKQEPADVRAGEAIGISFGGNNTPTHLNAYTLGPDGSSEPLELAEGTFRVPVEPGVYAYALSAKWTDEETITGDAAYGFVIRVSGESD